MKLSISNIAWQAENDEKIYTLMKEYGFTGLEIAPTRSFPESPYNNLERAGAWVLELKRQYGFIIPSMQSIWFGRQEKIFGTEAERQVLIDYTKKAVDFAATIGCGNLVFGCPRNRNVPEGKDAKSAIAFFKELGDYAAMQKTVIGMEANPPIYHTNFINDTKSAFRLVEEVNSEGFKLNLDVGTMIWNNENVDGLRGKVKLINHVHISEPELKPIKERDIHKKLHHMLAKEEYTGYVSIEMGRVDNILTIEEKLRYIKRIFTKEYE